MRRCEIVRWVEELFDLGPDSVRRFFATWYGPPDRVGGGPQAAVRCAGADLVLSIERRRSRLPRAYVPV
jgi:hypothetical protein